MRPPRALGECIAGAGRIVAGGYGSGEHERRADRDDERGLGGGDGGMPDAGAHGGENSHLVSPAADPWRPVSRAVAPRVFGFRQPG